jgi:hypothetical protein
MGDDRLIIWVLDEYDMIRLNILVISNGPFFIAVEVDDDDAKGDEDDDDTLVSIENDELHLQ